MASPGQGRGLAESNDAIVDGDPAGVRQIRGLNRPSVEVTSDDRDGSTYLVVETTLGHRWTSTARGLSVAVN